MPLLVDDVVDDMECVACTGCDRLIPRSRWGRELWVCAACGLSYPLGARCRILTLLDPRSMRVLSGTPTADATVLGDATRYAERLADARERTGLHEAVLCARGRIGGEPVVVAALDPGFLAGSIGTVAGEMLTRAAETALVEETPLVLVTVPGAARAEEGAVALIQIAKVATVFGQLDDAGLLTVALLTTPAGGVSTTLAMCADVVLAEPERITPDGGIPDGDAAMTLRRNGHVDMVVARARLRGELAALVVASATQRARPVPFAPDRVSSPIVDPGRMPENRRERVTARPPRPTVTDHIELVFDDFHELHGDRSGRDSGVIVAGLAGLAGRPVIVAGHQPRGRGRSRRVTAAAQRKLNRVVRLAAKLGMPVVTLVDTPGTDPADPVGVATATADSLRLMATLPVPVLSVIIGSGGGLGALSMAVANRVLMYADATYGASEPARHGVTAAGSTARDALLLGVVEGVIAEPSGGPTDHAVASQHLRAALLTALAELDGMSANDLIADRWARFRRAGAEGPVVAEAEGIVGEN